MYVLQVNLSQKLSFLNQLTHNVTRDCSLNYKKSTSSEHVVYKFCFKYQNNNKKNNFCTQHVLNLYFSCNSMKNLSSYCGLTDSRMRASNTYIFTCTYKIWKNISWKGRFQKRRILLQIKKIALYCGNIEKKGKEFLLTLQFLCLLFLVPFFCKHFIKSTCHEFPGSKSRCKSNKTRKLFWVSTLRIYCKFCRKENHNIRYTTM